MSTRKCYNFARLFTSSVVPVRFALLASVDDMASADADIFADDTSSQGDFFTAADATLNEFPRCPLLVPTGLSITIRYGCNCRIWLEAMSWILTAHPSNDVGSEVALILVDGGLHQ